MIRSRRSIFEVHVDARRSNPFGNLKKEEPKPAEVKPAVAAINPTVKKLEEVFAIAIGLGQEARQFDSISGDPVIVCYNIIGRALKDRGLRASNRDLVEFVIKNIPRMNQLFSNFQHNMDELNVTPLESLFGLFFSAVINTGSERAYTLDFRLYNFELRLLGYRNKKDVTIHSPASSNKSNISALGERMRSGVITIDSSPYLVGELMEGGVIILSGTTGSEDHISIGENASGGSIRFPASAKETIRKYLSNPRPSPGVSIFAGDECVYTPGDYI